MIERRSCNVDGCERPHLAGGWCAMHYRRWRKHGDVAVTKIAPRGRSLAWLRAAAFAETDACQFWPFGTGASGRGEVRWEGRRRLPYHVALVLVGREAPVPPLVTRHLCGNGHLGCVTVRHLAIGTYAENSADMVVHGTLMRGEGHYATKLLVADVLAIRDEPGRHRDIGARYGVSRQTVCGIKARKRWAWVTDGATP